MDVEPRRRHRFGRATVSGAVEPRQGTRGPRQRATEESGQEMKKYVLATATAFVLCTTAGADVGQLQRYVTTLASEQFGGRLTGTDGERLAREFIVEELKRIGAKPLPGQRDFSLPFEFTAGARDAGTALSVAGKARALAFSDTAHVSASVVSP